MTYFIEFSEHFASIETRLKSDLHSSELFHNSFKAFRKDRLDCVGGDVSIAISAALPSYSFEFPISSDVGLIGIRAKITNKQLYKTCSMLGLGPHCLSASL